jgi:hypothetical protein
MAPMSCPIWFAQSPTPVYINWKVEFWRSISILQLEVQKGASIGACPMFQWNCWWVNQYGSFKNKKSCEPVTCWVITWVICLKGKVYGLDLVMMHWLSHVNVEIMCTMW